MTTEVREAVAIKLRAKAIYALGEASVEEIDRFDILRVIRADHARSNLNTCLRIARGGIQAHS